MKRRSYLTTPNRAFGGRGGVFSSLGRLLTAVLALVVLGLLLLRLLTPGAFAALVAPVYRTGNALARWTGMNISLSSRAEVIADRDRLEARVTELENRNATLTARASDLERLLGGRTERAAGVLAGVLARPPVSPYDALVVDQGNGAGVRVGDAAFGPGGVPIGKVTSVEGESARVTLYSSTGQVTEGWAGAGRIPVKLTGTGAGGFDAEIAGAAGVLVDDEVYVPGPGALPIGIVVEVVADPSSPSVTLRIRPEVDPFSLTWVTLSR